MSVDDDLECISKIMQQSEKYICGEISKLHGELKNCNQSFRVCETKMKQQDVRIEKLECQVKAQDQKINILQTEKQNLLERVNAMQKWTILILILIVKQKCRRHLHQRYKVFSWKPMNQSRTLVSLKHQQHYRLNPCFIWR